MSKAKKKSAPAPAAEASLPLFLPEPVAALGAGLWLFAVAMAYAKKRLFFSSADWSDMAATLLAAPGAVGGPFAKNLLLAVLTWAGAAGWGCALRRRLAGVGPRCAECFVVNAGLGLGSLSLVLLAVAAAGAFTPAALRWLWGAGVVAGGALCWMSWHQAADEAPPGPGLRAGALVWVAGALIAFAAVGNLLAALAPEIFYDSLVYHLALPQLYLLRGALTATPENIYSGLP